MYHLRLTTIEQYWRDFERTPLNRQTDLLFAACHGQHVPSGKSVVREIEARTMAMPICANCGVPYKGAYISWNSKRKYDFDAEPAA